MEIGPKSSSRRYKWKCVCDCGNVVYVDSYFLKAGKTKSCGCLKREMISALNRKHEGKKLHPRLYRIWLNMRTRCMNPKYKEFDRYGGRGIRICDEWNDFSAFCSWSLSHGYSDGLTIERVDNDGNYEPSNCAWIPLADQARNKGKRRWAKRPKEM